MKVAVYLVDNVAPSAGGNFSYYDRLIRAIDNHQFSEPLEVCFTGRIPKSSVKLSKPYFALSTANTDRFFKIFRKTGVSAFLEQRLSVNIDASNKKDIQLLRKNKVDLILLPKQFVRDLEMFPFITMNWDAAHKSSYAFPEFVDDYAVRDEWFRVYIQKGMAIIVESEASKVEFAEFYNIHKSKIEVVPLFPGGVVDIQIPRQEQDALLSKFNLKQHHYFFYPAQFWAHKNHYNLILAFKDFLIQSRRHDVKLILTGSDKGNKEYIKSVIKEQGLDENVNILGFVSNEEMYALYKNALALTMSTFLGPTNMPVLEAMTLGVPVICSDLSGHRETCGEGALYAEPTDRGQWTKAMVAILDESIRQQLLGRAAAVQASSIFNITSAVTHLERVLLKLMPTRKTFS